MTNTPETPARIITENHASLIIQELDYWNDGIRDFQDETNETLRALKEKLENPTSENLEDIIDDLKAIFARQRMIQTNNAEYREGLEKRIKGFAAIWLKENCKKEDSKC